MNKYSWDLDYLIKTKKELERKVAIYESTLLTYQSLIASYDKRFNTSDFELKNALDGIYHDMDIKTFIEEILPYTNPQALEILLQVKDIFIEYQWDKNKVDYSPCYLNNKQLIDYTMSLIKQIPHKKFVNQIKSCTVSKRNLLHIKHANKLSTNYYGISFVDFVNNRPYGVIARENNVNDIITLAHELFHMVIKKDLDPWYVTASNSIYDEIEGYLANFIIRDLLKKDNYPAEEMDYIDTLDLYQTGWTVHDSFITNAILTFTDEKYKVNLSNINKYLKEEKIKTPVNRKNVDAFFHDKFNEALNYGFSYLVALDLYELYKQDPEKAINHLYNTKNFIGDNVEEELESMDVTFHEDGYQNLENKCNQLLKKRTTRTK